MPVPAAATAADVAKYFSDFMGPKALVVTGTGRPYVPIAKKGVAGSEATLLANVDFVVVPHKMIVNDKEQQIPAVGVCIRFFQRGGTETSFVPPLVARTKLVEVEGEDQKLMRLSKHTFPLCLAAPYVPIKNAWLDQNVTEQILDWLNGVCQFADATLLSGGLVEDVVTMPLARMEKPEGATNPTYFFSLDVHTDTKTNMGADEEPTEAE